MSKTEDSGGTSRVNQTGVRRVHVWRGRVSLARPLAAALADQKPIECRQHERTELAAALICARCKLLFKKLRRHKALQQVIHVAGIDALVMNQVRAQRRQVALQKLPQRGPTGRFGPCAFDKRPARRRELRLEILVAG